MTAHKATRAGRRRRGGPAHALAGGRKGRLWGGVAAIAVLGAAGFAAVGWDGKQVHETLQRIAEALRRHPIAEFVSSEFE